MAIQVNGTTVIDNSRALTNISSVDSATAAAIGAAGVGGGFTNTASVNISSTSFLWMPLASGYDEHYIVMDGFDVTSSATNWTTQDYYAGGTSASKASATFAGRGGSNGFLGGYNSIRVGAGYSTANQVAILRVYFARNSSLKTVFEFWDYSYNAGTGTTLDAGTSVALTAQDNAYIGVVYQDTGPWNFAAQGNYKVFGR